MAREDKVLMSVKALRRLHAIHQVMEKELGQVEAGRLLGRTDRQVRRIVKRVRESGDEPIQMDGSHHPWFEERGPACVSMAYVDDASSRVFARFCGSMGMRGRSAGVAPYRKSA